MKNMLIEFSVKNYRSIKEKQTLSTVKSKASELESNTFLNDGLALPLLRSCVIYGANASGKSNLIKSLHTMKKIICNSASSMRKGEELPITAFLFDENSSNKASEFEIIFVHEGIKYQYGFLASKFIVVEEWLYAYPQNRPQRWFYREYDQETVAYNYKFSDYLVGQKKVWAKATRSNALFLSTAVQLNGQQLTAIYNWFNEHLIIAPINSAWGHEFTSFLCDDDASKEKVLSFLKAADFDIDDINIKTEELKNKDIRKIKTTHKTKQGNSIDIDIAEESEGTQAFFTLSGHWIHILENGYVLVVDELSDSLHSNLLNYLISLFHNSKTNPNNAQLIFSTHDTSILHKDKNVFRRDQIWFCEKNSDQETQLFPLTDFSPRKNRENLEQSYLTGRYGAVPHLRSSELNDVL